MEGMRTRGVGRYTPNTFKDLLLDLSGKEDSGASFPSTAFLRNYYRRLFPIGVQNDNENEFDGTGDETSEEEDDVNDQDSQRLRNADLEALGNLFVEILNKAGVFSADENTQISHNITHLLETQSTKENDEILKELKTLVPIGTYSELSRIICGYLKAEEVQDHHLDSHLNDGTPESEALKISKRLIIANSIKHHISDKITALTKYDDPARIKTGTSRPAPVKSLEKILRDLEKYIDKIKDTKELTEILEKEVDLLHILPNTTERGDESSSHTSNYVPEKKVKYPHVYIYSTSQSDRVIEAIGATIPENAVYNDTSEYVEVLVPAGQTAPVLPEERRIKVSALPACIQSAFEGYNTLNTVQSLTFHTVFETNENMLVCAPTGAGKTDVALIAILKVLMEHMTNGAVVDTQNFKVVYITPMKALASEIVAKLSSRIGKPKSEGGIEATVMEYTGDTALNRSEIAAASVIVATPEKWDATTRSSLDESELLAKTRLLILDEIHILNEARGGVIESIVARFQRYVNIKQSMVRIIGLSATLPNYVDVANFLGVNPHVGMFYFDSSYRPLPLEQRFIGIKRKPQTREFSDISYKYCHEKIIETLMKEQQVMVFVHSRAETLKAAKQLLSMISKDMLLDLIDPRKRPGFKSAIVRCDKLHDTDVKSMFGYGIGIHNAGISRSGRNFVESTFQSGLTRIICTTSTLAWGVNMPASCVIIKGTKLYSPENTRFEDISITDVLQIFGRAGRPQYETLGTAYIITSHDKLHYYVASMLNQAPVESHFESCLIDNLNAEIALGTVATVTEALKWLDYTFLSTRMNVNPIGYRVTATDNLDIKSAIEQRKREVVIANASILDRLQMIVFDKKNETFFSKELGQIASSSYITYSTVEVFNTFINPTMDAADAISTLCLASEFCQLKTRKNEEHEIQLLMENFCLFTPKGQIDDPYHKASVLLQSHISRTDLKTQTLLSDRAYIAKNASRILVAMFKIACSRNWGSTALIIHTIKKSVDNCMWPLECQLRQFYVLPERILKLIEGLKNISVCDLKEMSPGDIGKLIRNDKLAPLVHEYLWYLPDVTIDTWCTPINQIVLKVIVKISLNFKWNNVIHGISEPWWLWIEDANTYKLLHYESFTLRPKLRHAPMVITFTIPFPEMQGDQKNNQIVVRAFSDTWVGCEACVPISLSDINVPERNQEYYTELLDLRPLPISAFDDSLIEEIYRPKFKYFNPLQTQIFHALYNGNSNTFLGAPTGSGKTIAAELAIWGFFRKNTGGIAVYMAPLKALVAERHKEWTERFGNALGLKIVKMTGEVTPDVPSLNSADIIVTTPEKWDGVTRFWRNRSYVKRVSLIIIDEIHMLGGDRGHVIEMSITRMKIMSRELEKKIRIVGLSTAFSNSLDVGEWIEADSNSIFNFRNSVRPVPLEVYVDSFFSKYYCPRMDSMNKPIYNSIMTRSPDKPVIIFVSSRRQTRLTAKDLISFCNMQNCPKRFLHTTEEEIRMVADNVKDDSLRFFLQYGVGMHHAGLNEQDRSICEQLFKDSKIQILVATSTLAWGVNFPAHMVIIKGTEYYDVSISGYKDFSITDILQMMGRAGRPQFDSTGVAHIMVQDIKKDYYKRFLYEPFPLESMLQDYLPDHMNAEIASGTINTRDDMVKLLSKTFMYNRMHTNPSFYGVKDKTVDSVNKRLSEMVNEAVDTLNRSKCIKVLGLINLAPTKFGKISAFYYVSNSSVKLVQDEVSGSRHIHGDMVGFAGIVKLISKFQEFEKIPVRHNEDKYNKILEGYLPHKVYVKSGLLGHNCFNLDDNQHGYASPHVKTFILLMARMCGIKDEIVGDYVTDTYTVLGSCVRVIQAAIDVTAELSNFEVALTLMILLQCIKQCLLPNDIPLIQVPHITREIAKQLVAINNWKESEALYEMMNMDVKALHNLLMSINLDISECKEIERYISELPQIGVNINIIDAEMNVEGSWVLKVDTKYELKITITRKHTGNCPCTVTHKCHTVDFPGTTRESWWCMLSGWSKNTLIALSRLSSFRRAHSGGTGGSNCAGTVTLYFHSPSSTEEGELGLYVISDSYYKIDCVKILKFTMV